MDWLPVMDFYLFLTVAVGLITVIVFLFVPAMVYLHRREKNTDRANRPRICCTKAGYCFHFVVALLTLVALTHASYAPNTWLGAWVKGMGGFGVWTFCELVVSCLVAYGLHMLGIQLFYMHDPVWDDPNPVKVWKPIEAGAGKELHAGLAYAIEMQNDNKTSMVFVFGIFCRCFGMTRLDAYREVLAIHEQGTRIVGSMSRLNAEALLEHIHVEAAKRGFPFQCKVVLASTKTAVPDDPAPIA